MKLHEILYVEPQPQLDEGVKEFIAKLIGPRLKKAFVAGIMSGAIALSAMTPAMAADYGNHNWSKYVTYQTPSGLQSRFVDRQAMVVNGHTVSFWVLADFKDPQTIKDVTYNSTTTLVTVDCEQEEFKTSTHFHADHMGKGEIVYDLNRPMIPMSIMPDVEKQMMDTCKVAIQKYKESHR